MAKAPSAQDQWTFAVVAHRVDADPDLEGLRRRLDTVLALGPRFVLLLSDVGTTSDGRFTVNGRPADLGPDTVPVPIFVLPGTHAERVRDHLAIDCEPFGRILFLRAASLTTPSPGERSAATDTADLEMHVAGLAPDRSLLVVLDRPAWEDDVSCWDEVARRLGKLELNRVVALAGSDRFTWWREGQLEYLTIAQLPGAQASASDLSDGVFSGVAWGSFSIAGAQFQILRGSGSLPIHRFSRADQLERERVKSSVTLTPASDHDPMSLVQCRNSTQKTLTYKTNWSFSRSGVKVDPQVLGFTLAPGEEFRQEFRFEFGRDVPMKFLVPSFSVSVAGLAGPLGPTSQQTTVAPWCVMGGEIGPMVTAPVWDGWPSEWSGTAYEVNHVSQVVDGADAWRGPGDSSGAFFAASHADGVYLAVTVHDDNIAAVSSTRSTERVQFFIDLRSRGERQRTGGRFTGREGLLQITAWRTGEYSVEVGGRDAEGIGVFVTTRERGFGVEVDLGAAHVPHLALDGELLVDVAIYDLDPPEQRRKVLFFSGNEEDLATSRYFAVLKRKDVKAPSGMD